MLSLCCCCEEASVGFGFYINKVMQQCWNLLLWNVPARNKVAQSREMLMVFLTLIIFVALAACRSSLHSSMSLSTHSNARVLKTSQKNCRSTFFGEFHSSGMYLQKLLMVQAWSHVLSTESSSQKGTRMDLRSLTKKTSFFPITMFCRKPKVQFFLAGSKRC